MCVCVDGGGGGGEAIKIIISLYSLKINLIRKKKLLHCFNLISCLISTRLISCFTASFCCSFIVHWK